MKMFPSRILALSLLLALPLCVQAQTPLPGHPPMPGQPGAKSMTCEEALKQAPKLDPSLAPLDKAFKDADAQLKKSPKDEKAKKTYVEAAYKYGKTAEDNVSQKLSRPVQYRAALALYRRALAVDPKHKPSLDEKRKIDEIYASMPGGVPK